LVCNVFRHEENVQRLQRTQTFARQHHVTVAQAALAYVLAHLLNAFAVVGCTKYKKFAENVGACSLKLDEATLHWLAPGQGDNQ
jgi:aryl-alcohol dehydrogenase-like predicted oxidoreductase